MSETKKLLKKHSTAKLICKNTLLFLFNIAFVWVYQMIFGQANILPGVAVCVAATMFPITDFGIRPLTMVFITFLLFLGSGLTAQLALASPLIALPINFVFVMLIMLLTSEPYQLKPFICFLLCFIFSQATPVPWSEFPLRMESLLIGSVIVCAATVIWWRKKGYGKNARSLKEQVLLSSKRKSLILRMSVGLALAMLIGMAFHLKKPLWISIVVMSLTQLEFSETFLRIKYRVVATLIGSAVFVILFQILVPAEFSMLLIMLFCYLSFYTPEYKYKQIANAICALNASLLLLNTPVAIENRFLCLLSGIGIVLLLILLHHVYQKLRHRPVQRLLNKGAPRDTSSAQNRLCHAGSHE